MRITAVTTPGIGGASTSNRAFPYLNPEPTKSESRLFVYLMAKMKTYKNLNVELIVAPSASLSFTPSFVLIMPLGLSRKSSRPSLLVLYELGGLIATKGECEWELASETDDGEKVLWNGSHCVANAKPKLGIKNGRR
jgi:hypothetical protein